jgi:ankyrin repeat protein
MDTKLKKAVAKGDLELVRAALRDGADVNCMVKLDEIDPLYQYLMYRHEVLHYLRVDEQKSSSFPVLTLAVKNGNVEIMKELLQSGADVNLRSSSYLVGPLHVAAMKDDKEALQELLKKGADVDLKDGVDKAPIHYASKKGHIEALQELIKCGADVNLKGRRCKAPIHYASKGGHTEALRELIKYGADVNLKDWDDKAPIHYASAGGHTEALQEIIKCGADVNLKDLNSKAPIHYAIEGGYDETARELIKSGADVNIKDGWGKAPICYATEGGHTQAVLDLIKGGAYGSLKDGWGKALMHYAIEVGDTQILLDLIKFGAHVNPKDKALMRYATEGGHTEILWELVKRGADVSLKDEDHKAPIHYASKGGHTQAIMVLIKGGADVDLKDWGRKSPIHYATEGGHAESLRVLIKGGADVNLKDLVGKAPMHYAIEGGHTEVLQELIKGGADVDSQDNHGQGPIFGAVSRGHVDIVEVLIQNGVDVSATDCQGQTPIQCGLLSYEPRSCEAILELIHHGARLAVVDPGNVDNTTTAVLHSLYWRDRNLYIEAIKGMIIQGDKLCATDRKALSLELLETLSNLEVVRILCDNQHCLHFSDEFGRTVLHNIVGLGHHKAINTLLLHGVIFTATDAIGHTLLHSAVPIGNEETVHNLLNVGCDLKALDKFGRSVLHLASFYGHCKLMEIFISRGLDPNAIDSDGRNSLHFAVMNRQDEAVRVLCKNGAEVIDKSGMTPLDYLHPCEKRSLTFQQLHGNMDCLPFLRFNEEFSPSITIAPKLAEISRIPGFGSVQSIKEFTMEDFLKNIMTTVGDIVNKVLPGVKLKLIGCGSSFEGSKIVMPDEVDFLITLDMLDGAHLPIADGEGYLSMCGKDRSVGLHGSYSVWLWHKLVTWWSAHQIDGKSDKTFQMPFPPLRHPEHTTCVNWVWLFSDDVFHMMPVSIDLVIAMHDDKRGLYIVPKVPAESYVMERLRNEDKSFGRMSYPPQEVQHLRSLPPEDKDVYVTAKCLRLPEISGFKVLDDKGNIRIVSEYATSYRLKTVFLHLSEMFKESKLSHGRKVLLVYEWLESCLEREKLPMFFNRRYNVLAGSRLSTPDSLKVVRAMTKFVRELYERDYESEAAQDEEEVKRIQDMIPSCLSDTEEKKEEEAVQTMGTSYILVYDEEKGVLALRPSDPEEREEEDEEEEGGLGYIKLVETLQSPPDII